MKKTYKLFYFLIISLLSVFLFSCSRKAEPVSSAVLNTVITFVSGEAYVIDGSGEKKEAETGESLFPEYELITMSDSFLEFKIGSSGIIRMDSDTRLSLSDFSQKTEKDYTSSDITLSLTAGAIIQKVKKLTGYDNYTIKTASAAFGVRGTEFLVETSGEKDTLAVKSGTVIASLYPDQLEKLKEKALAGDEDYKKIYTELESSFPLLKSGEEVVIRSSDLEKGKDFLDEINSIIEKADSGEISGKDAAVSISEKAVSAAESVSLSEIVPVPLSEDRKKFLNNTDSFILKEKSLDTELYIKTEPAGAAVYFNGNLAGYGSLKALLSSSRIITVRVEKDGYYPFEKKIKTGDIKDSPYIIVLEKKEGSVSLTAVPSDSEITVAGIGTFKGKYSGQFDPGSRVEVTVKRAEYETEKAVYVIDENTSIDSKIILKPMLIPLRFTSGLESGAFFIMAQRDSLLSAGIEGGFSFFSKNGDKIWNSASSYTGRPLVAADSLFTVSGNRLEKRDLETGISSGTIDLEDSPYMNPEYYEGSVFINSGSDIFRINPENMEKERTYVLPDMSVSTPFYYKGRLFSVTDKGVLHIYGENDLADSSISVARGNPEGIDITAEGNTAYFAGINGAIFAMNTDTADFLWDSNFESDGSMPEISLRDDKIVLETGGSLSFYSSEGSLLFEPVKEIDAWTFIHQSDFAYVKGGNILYICDISNGTIKKQGKVEDGIKDIEVINDRIYLLKEDGSVLEVNPDALSQ